MVSIFDHRDSEADLKTKRSAPFATREEVGSAAASNRIVAIEPTEAVAHSGLQ